MMNNKHHLKFQTTKSSSLIHSIPLLITSALLSYSSITLAASPVVQYELELFSGPLATNPYIPDTPWTNFSDISDNGMVAWQSATYDSDFHFIEAFGVYDVENDVYMTSGLIDHYLDVETGFITYGINNRGTIVTGESCMVVDKKDNSSQLPLPPELYCSTRGISSKGVISGFTIDVGGTWRGFVYDSKNDVFEDFIPNAGRTIAQGISSKGDVVGSTGDTGDFDGFLREHDGSSRMFRVNIDGVRYSTQARGLTNDGIIAGVYYTIPGGMPHGFVGRLSDDPADLDLIPDTVFDPNEIAECDAGVFLTRINNDGIISGICYGSDYTERGLLLTPLSE